MTGRRSHGRLSALNGVVHQGRDALDFGYTQDRFEACISAHFVIAKTEPLQSGTRTMYFARPTRTGPGG